MIKNYKQFESLLDKMIGPSEEELIRNGLDKYLKIMIVEGNINGVKKAIELGVDLNQPGTIFLHLACIWNRVEIVKIILKNGIRDENAETYFHLYEKKYSDIIEILEKHFNTTFEDKLKKDPYTYLKYGIYENNKEIINSAIRLGADYKRKFNLWLCVAKKADIKIVKYFMFLGVGWDEDALEYYQNNIKNDNELYNLLIDYREAKRITNIYSIKENYKFDITDEEIDLFIKNYITKK